MKRPKPPQPPDPEAESRELLALIGTNLRILRQQAGLAQRETCARSGISQRHWSAIELGKANVTIQTLVVISAAVDAKPINLLVPVGMRLHLTT